MRLALVGLERRAVAAIFPCRDEALPKRAEPLARDSREQRPLVGEVSIEGGARHAQPGAYFTQGQPCGSIPGDRLERLVEERPRDRYLQMLIEALGGTVVDFAGAYKCCGFPIITMHKENSLRQAGTHLGDAADADGTDAS